MRKTGQFAMLIGNHFTNASGNWEGEYLWGNFHMGNITVKHRTVIKHNFEEFLKGAKKPFQ